METRREQGIPLHLVSLIQELGFSHSSQEWLAEHLVIGTGARGTGGDGGVGGAEGISAPVGSLLLLSLPSPKLSLLKKHQSCPWHGRADGSLEQYCEYKSPLQLDVGASTAPNL